MRGFWLPIGLRAAAIFACGMLLYAGGRYVKRHTHFSPVEGPDIVVSTEAAKAMEAAADARMNAVRATENAVQAGVNAGLSAKVAKLDRFGALSSLADLSRSKAVPPAFIFDGARLGSLVRLKGGRDARDTQARVAVVVRLDQGRKASSCDIAPVHPDDFELDQGFRCAASDAGLVSVGSVRFEPGATTRAIKASPRMAEQLAKGEPFAIDADLTGPMNLTVNGKDGERVRLQSDSQNTALVVRDDAGKEVVRMQAGKNGFSITVDTTGH